ncbi:MAG: Gfo/Idh/MocA family protein [Rubripirellula sp.]
MDRRQFSLAASTLLANAATECGDVLGAEKTGEKSWRVAVIGHTGRGDFGHGLDTVWLRIPNANIVAVADANESGLKKELSKLQLQSGAGYGDYCQMLQRERPEIVVVCPRHLDQHHDMIMAAVAAGARGIYVEKPFVRSPAEADSVIAACGRSGTKLAIAHRNRYHPTLQRLDKMIANGDIGKLLEIRGRGKGDRRGGSEDLWVLGSHVLNLMAYFGGSPKSCSAVMYQDGDRVDATDVAEGREGLGLLAGNELHATYRLENGVTGYFDSIANDGTKNHGFGLQLIGSEGVIQIRCDAAPLAHLIAGNPFEPTVPRSWVPISSAGAGVDEPIADMRSMIHGHELPARDLLEAVEKDREPLCGLSEAAETVEMISAVFESHRLGREVRFPLESRVHPLTRL